MEPLLQVTKMRHVPVFNVVTLFATFVMLAPSIVFAEPARKFTNSSLEITFEGVDRSSWLACIAAAEGSRSRRDLEFFIKGSNLLDAKSWFVRHSRANEERFCLEIALCEKRYDEHYSKDARSYSQC